MSTSTSNLSGEKLERRLEELLHQDRFEPPRDFVATARVNDASVHARSELDPDAFWAEQLRDPTVMAELAEKIAAAQAQED